MIIVIVIDFFFVAVACGAGTRKEGTFTVTNETSTKKSTIVQSLGIRDFTKPSFIQFTRGEWWIR